MLISRDLEVLKNGRKLQMEAFFLEKWWNNKRKRAPPCCNRARRSCPIFALSIFTNSCGTKHRITKMIIFPKYPDWYRILKSHSQNILALKALANEDTLLRTHCCRHKCFPVCPRAQHLLRTQKMFLILFRNILCPQQIFPSLRSSRNIMDKNVSATMCPRLPGLPGKGMHRPSSIYLPLTRRIIFVVFDAGLWLHSPWSSYDLQDWNNARSRLVSTDRSTILHSSHSIVCLRKLHHGFCNQSIKDFFNYEFVDSKIANISEENRSIK